MKSKKDAFPDQQTLQRVRDKLSAPSYSGGNLALPNNATETERAKYLREHKLMQKDLAEKLGVDEARISDLLRGKTESFTLDRLIGYAEKLHPGLRIQISAA